MNRKLKTLGLIFFAVFAVGATTATSAQAFVIRVEKAGAKITASSEGKMNFGFGLLSSIKCADTEESAETGETELGEEILAPTFKECLFAGQPIAIDDNGCNYDY